MAIDKHTFRLTAREKVEWDAAALAQLVLALARQRVAERRADQEAESTSPEPASGEAA